jgi:hypothetical protein
MSDVPKHVPIVTAIKALPNYNAVFVNAVMALIAPLMENDLRKIHTTTFS